MQYDYSTIIIETINKIFSNFFSSMDNSLYSLLDKTIFIDSSIISNSLFTSLFYAPYGISNIINSLLLGFFIYYCFRLHFSSILGIYTEKPHQFIFKSIIIILCTNNSIFICSELLNINSIITDILCSLGASITGKEISFNSLISSVPLNNFVDNYNIFSIEGLLKSFLSFGLISLLFSYSIRYMLLKILIFLFPFSLLTLITPSTSWIFKSWFRTFFSLLFVQNFIVVILIFLFSLTVKSSNLFSQITYISTIFILTNANSYLKELIGGISTDINSNLLFLKNIHK